ncbi:MAG: MucB/RseB C-terminal domain-containing protein [Pseudomonadota bacterium]
MGLLAGAFFLAFAAARALAAPAETSVAVPVAPPAPAPVAGEGRVAERGELGAWLLRAQEASRRRTYVGTFVVLSSSGAMATSRIWHVADGEQQVERMDALSGAPRSTLRRNEHVITFLPESHVARSERREAFGLFPHLQRVGIASLADFYTARVAGSERVAGLDTDVLQLQPKDGLRYGYRLSVEKKTGFAVQLQTLATDGRVLEQAAFSDLDLDATVHADKLLQMMANTAGYRVEKLDKTRTTAAEEGWALRAPVPGFEPMDCYRRVAPTPTQAGAAVHTTLQWTFSDGLATVSLFVEPYGPRPRREWQSAAGMTQMVGRRVSADWWLTAMGEVPVQTLQAFAAALERRK